MQDDQERTRPSVGLSTEDLAGTGGATREPDLSSGSSSGAAGHAVFPGEATGDFPGETGAAERDTTGEADAAAGTAGATDGSGVATAAGSEEPRLLDADQEKEIRERWQTIQTGFVDDPRDTVQAADALVAELMQRLAALFAERRQGLEDQWHRGEKVDTEDLRLALQQYRSFFNRLLTT